MTFHRQRAHPIRCLRVLTATRSTVASANKRYSTPVTATESTSPHADPRGPPSASITPKLSQDYKHTGLADRPTPSLFSLHRKALIVTGAARGLGLMVARAAIQSGSPLVYCLDIAESPDSAEWPAAEQLAEDVGGRLVYRRVDVTDERAVDEVVGRIYEEGDQFKQDGDGGNRGGEGEGGYEVAGYFGSAGMIHQIPAVEYPADAFRRVLDVNTTGSFLTMRATAREMMKRNIKGSIALVASMSGSIANQGIPAVAYNTSKAACLQLARSCAAEWGPHGIRVNHDTRRRSRAWLKKQTLSPGYIRTSLTDKLLTENPALEQLWLSGSMLDRLSTPDEFRGPAMFLLGDASSFMTGADLRVDGGHTAY